VHLKDLISHPHEKPPRKKREKGREGKEKLQLYKASSLH
jgi:hypothetical protein